jgi:phage terminase small subunit
MAKDSLSERHIKFCQEYIIDLNGAQAAIRSGYSENTAREQASQILSKPDIQEYVQELLDDRAARTRATADKVVSEIYHLISFDVSTVFDEKTNTLKDIHSIPKESRKSIASIEVFEEYSGKGDERTLIGYTKKVKFWDKTKSIELLAKHLKLLTDKMEVGGPGGTPLLPLPAIIIEPVKSLEAKPQ